MLQLLPYDTTVFMQLLPVRLVGPTGNDVFRDMVLASGVVY